MSMYDLKTREGCTRQAAFKNACDCLYYGYGTIKIGLGNGGWFLLWNHFGSSAQRISLKNLKWILDVIFESKNYEYSIE